VAENSSIPLNDTTLPVDSEEEGRSTTMDRQWLRKYPESFGLVFDFTME